MAAGVVLFTGPTGAGKSLQAERVARTHGWIHLSSGVILRQSTLPRVVAELQAGALVDPDATDAAIDQAMGNVGLDEVMLFDGFPRETSEMHWLDRELVGLDRKIVRVVLLDIDRAESERRVLARGRGDDGPSQVAQKWQWYERDVMPIIDQYESRGLLTRVDGRGTPDEVTARLEQALADTH
jgi:adenylate kinase